VDTSRAFDPQDSSPGVWDVNFYNQTMQSTGVPMRVFKFPSDVALSQHPLTAVEWYKFATDQEDWNQDYAREYVRMSLLGVDNINNLTDCSKVLPPAQTSYAPPDKTFITSWLAGKYPKLGSILDQATTITQSLLTASGITPTLRKKGLIKA
jgi:hypothetical protein